jgi:hypothetical protein
MTVFMATHEKLKAIFGSGSRSGFHHFLSSVFPTDRTLEAGCDVLGCVIVVSLTVGTVFLVRLLLVY